MTHNTSLSSLILRLREGEVTSEPSLGLWPGKSMLRVVSPSYSHVHEGTAFHVSKSILPVETLRGSFAYHMSDFLFKPDIASHLTTQWPDLWEPLRTEFIRFCHQCVANLGTPPIVITCLARTQSQNAAIGGKPTSLHLARPCRAIDIRRRGFDPYAEQMKALWQGRGAGWDFVIEGPPHNRKAPHFHLEADWRVG